ncbi:MAG: plasmid pRiA4b ORF-3 family protein [Bacteroidetes bacterium]|nr:plasmid pRiA4b ORF-3 family protein [Bacteroidota bacterium]
MTALLRINATLRHVTPKIWRELTIPGNCTFHETHAILQLAFGWESYHLYQFPLDRETIIADPEMTDAEELGRNLINSRTTLIDKILTDKGKSVLYEYDFGDGWQVDIRVLEALDGLKLSLPVCLKGERSGPLEDSGGPSGYMNLIKIMSDKKHPEYKEIKKWIGAPFNPEEFNADDVTESLSSYKSLALELNADDDFEDEEFLEEEEDGFEGKVSAVIIRPTLDALKYKQKLNPKFKIPEHAVHYHDLAKVFMIPYMDDSELAFDFMEKNHGMVLLEMYTRWFGEPANWPQNLDWKTFNKYFSVEFESEVDIWPLPLEESADN